MSVVFSNEVSVNIVSSGPAKITLNVSATSVTDVSSNSLFTLSGTVTDNIGNPVAGTNVYFWFKDTNTGDVFVIGPTTTGSNGTFSYGVPSSDVSEGASYDIIASNQNTQAPSF